MTHLSDGTTGTTTNVRWSSDTGLIRVDASGLATAGQQIGDDTLSAEVATGSGLQRTTREILVLQPGTFRMIGSVTENGEPPTPIAGARVEVTGGTPAATTGWDGRFRLFGVPGAGTIRVSRDGYEPHVQGFQLTEHASQNFQLTLAGTRLDLAGPYTLAVEAACQTSTPVPADLRRGSYAATLTQNGANLEVLLTEPRFRSNSAGRGNRFTGRVDAAGATFRLEDFSGADYDNVPADPATYANVVERLPSGKFLIVTGTAVTKGSSGALSGDLQGYFSHFDSRFPSVPLLASAEGTCYSLAHRFTLTRR
jgi:hypothetical protein